jgi:hypothetical protein
VRTATFSGGIFWRAGLSVPRLAFTPVAHLLRACVREIDTRRSACWVQVMTCAGGGGRGRRGRQERNKAELELLLMDDAAIRAGAAPTLGPSGKEARKAAKKQKKKLAAAEKGQVGQHPYMMCESVASQAS